MTVTRDAGIELRSSRGRWVLLATILGSGAIGIDASVVNIALPAIGKDFGVGFGALQWTVVAYTLTLASFILLGGTLGDRFGRRRVFLIGIVWFALASVVCGLAPDQGWLIAARALQGAGGALATPAALAILESVFVPDDRGRAIGAWAGLSGVTTAIAPFVGGWLLQVATWRWVFLINAPIVVAVVVIALRSVPETRDPGPHGRLDVAGGALGAIGLAGVTDAIIAAPDAGAGIAVVLPALIGVAALVAFVLVERRAADPMLPLHLFRSRVFRVTNVDTFLIYGAIGGFFVLLPVALEVVPGWSPLAAGSALLPITAATLLLSEASGQLASRLGPRLQMTAGPVLCGGGALLALRIGADASFLADVLPVVLLFGLGLACLVAPLTATALGSVGPEHAGIASGVNNAVARAGSLLAVATLPAVSGLTGAAYTEPAAFVVGFHVAAVLCAALFGLGALVAFAGLAAPRATPRPARADGDGS